MGNHKSTFGPHTNVTQKKNKNSDEDSKTDLPSLSPPWSTAASTCSGLSDNNTNTQLPSQQPQKLTQISTENIQNGVTGKFISITMVEQAYMFWKSCVSDLPEEDKLEIGCSIFFTMMQSNVEMKTIMAKNLRQRFKIETLGLKFIDMMGWLFRQLLLNEIDFHATLRTLGKMHQQMGIRYSHFGPMLSATHSTLQFYFPGAYTIRVRYAMETVFMIAAKIMNGITTIDTMMCQNDNFKDLSFLSSLQLCLMSNVGKEYLFGFLKERYCNEIAIYLISISKFKAAMSDKERLIIARGIVKTSIDRSSKDEINVSSDHRETILKSMERWEEIFISGSGKLRVRSTLFDDCTVEVVTLLQQNVWAPFVKDMMLFVNSSQI